MSARRIVAIAAAGVLVAGVSGAAIAAVSKDDPKKAEQQLLDNAAKRLNVPPQKLRDALSAAQDDRLDEAVKNGDLTRQQADAIKERRKRSGTVLGHGGKGPGRHGMHPRGHRFALLTDLAKGLGLDARELRAKLRDGESIADVAKEQGKSLADVRSVVKAAAKTRADRAVENGRLTRKQADALLEHLDERLEHLDRMPRLRERGRFRGAPLPPHARPGDFEPAPGGVPPAVDGRPSTF